MGLWKRSKAVMHREQGATDPHITGDWLQIEMKSHFIETNQYF